MYYADLTGPPTRYTLSVLGKQLAHTRPDVAERLQKALQPGKETPLLKEFLSTHRTFVDIMKAFNVKELNFKEFLSSVNCIVPRKYSISSGPLEHPFDPSVVSAYVPVSTDKVCICSNFFLSLTLDRWCSARYWWS
jgi:cytochrome P450/NADPH-cytochrome P450 reductase